MNVVQLRREYSIFLPLILLPVLARISLRRLLLVLMFPVCVMASYSVIQYYWGVDWIPPFSPLRAHESASGTVYYAKGSFSHHLTFSGYMLLVLLLFAGLFWRGEGRDRIIWGCAALMAGAGVIVSLGRSGWVGMAIGLLLLVLGFPRRLALPLTAAVLLLGLAVSAVATGWLQGLKPWLPEWGIVNRLISTSLTHDRERLYLWESALLGIQDRPWFGVGYGNDKRYMRKYRAQVTEKRHYQFSVRPSTHSHNVYLQVAFELGIVGLAWYLAFWGVILVWSVRWARRARDLLPFETALLTGISVALVGSMVAGFFENNFFDAEVRTMILTLMGLSLYVGLSVRRQLREPPQ